MPFAVCPFARLTFCPFKKKLKPYIYSLFVSRPLKYCAHLPVICLFHVFFFIFNSIPVSKMVKKLNTKYASLSKVKRHVAKRILYSHPVRPKDEPVYHSNVYNIWNLVYDAEQIPCKGFFQCKTCGLVENVDLSMAGNKKLSRHPCYKAYTLRVQALAEAKKKVD